MTLKAQASDLHLSAGIRPIIRRYGALVPLVFRPMDDSELRAVVYASMTDAQVAQFEADSDIDFSYLLHNRSQFRVNVFIERRSICAMFRAIPLVVPTLDSLEMPPIIRELALRPRGLVLVTGPSGSGKSTTLAAMIHEINISQRKHIITLEDPIEYMHSNEMSEIHQREIGIDTPTFSSGLRHVLRQDPDVVLIGEMRDLESIDTALTAAETGHLVLATLHTNSAAKTMDRIIHAFPAHQHDQIRLQLASTLEGIITQTLLPTADGNGRVCVQEILLALPAVRNLIRENKNHQISSAMQSGSRTGMQTFDQSLQRLVESGKLRREDALAASGNPEGLTNPGY